MDTSSAITRLAFAIIIGVLSFFVWKWWQGTRSLYTPQPTDSPAAPAAPAMDQAPQGAGITMYGSDSCPWCTKQKDYFKEKKIEYTFVDCAQGQCPNFVTGYPTLVINGEIKPGYQEI